jgi:copper(I)-binding protein
MRCLKFLTVLGFLTASLVGAGGLAGVQAAQAQDYKLGNVEIAHSWARPSTGKTGAAYFTLTNHGTSDDTLLSAASDAAAKVQIHDMKMDGNIMRMRKLDDLPLPAGQTVNVAPGGIHIMMIGLVKPLSQGDTIAMHLEFAKAGGIDVAVPVQMKPPAKGEAAASQSDAPAMGATMPEMGEMPNMHSKP